MIFREGGETTPLLTAAAHLVLLYLVFLLLTFAAPALSISAQLCFLQPLSETLKK